MNPDDSDVEGRERFLRLAGWSLGGFLILFALVAFSEAGSGGITAFFGAIIGGLLFLGAGLLLLPATRPYISNSVSRQTGFQMSGVIIAGLVTLGFIGGIGILAASQPPDVSPVEEADDETPTDTVTSSSTPTSTATDAATETATAARATDTVSQTRTRSGPGAVTTSTPTPTFTRTRTPTPTRTQTSTPTPTASPAATPTPASNGDDSAISLRTIQYTGEGSDHENPNNEWVEFENTGDGAVNLRGWRVEDDANHEYRFGEVTLQPGDTVRLYTGKGSNTDSEVYWGSGRAIWNDNGDTVYLWNDDGELIVEFEYSGNEGGQAPP